MAFYEGCKNIVYDAWLSDILGRKVYKIVVDKNLFKNAGTDKLKDLQSQRVFLYAKVPVDHLQEVFFLEEAKFHLIDTNVLLEKSVSAEATFTGHVSLRLAKAKDELALVELARKSFQFSRFHLDSHFLVEMANRIKGEWVRSYFKGTRGENMVVASLNHRIKGFLQLLQIAKDTLMIDLVATEEDMRNKGVASDMIRFAQLHCGQGFKKIAAGTQISNVPSLRLYEKLGFRIKESFYVFHYHQEQRGK